MAHSGIFLGKYERLWIATLSNSILFSIVKPMKEMKMKWIKGIYTLPKSMNVFLIMSDPHVHQRPESLIEESKQAKKLLEHIVRGKNKKLPKGYRQWITTQVLEQDFLSSIKELTAKEGAISNPSYHDPIDIDLLTINVLKSSDDSCEELLESKKVLSRIPEHDIIEVFI